MIADQEGGWGAHPPEYPHMRSSTLALCALILVAPCSTAFAQTPAAQDQQGQRGFLSPEQRAMFHAEQLGADIKAMTPDQRAAMRDQMRAKWEAMSDADKQALKARLQAKWDALSPADKQAIEQKIADRRAHWQNQGQNSGH
jgi:hypothetical protein